MKKKIIGGVILILVIAISVFAITSYTTGEGDRASVSDVTEEVDTNTELNVNKVEVDRSKSKFEFEGFAVGKSHVATFDDWNGFLIFDENNKLIGGEGIIKPESVNTGIDRLNTHLKSDDFFDVAQFPEITFKTISIEGNNVKGLLAFRGVTKEVSFPAVITENSISAEFFLDTTPFSFKYTAVNKEVRIKFDLIV